MYENFYAAVEQSIRGKMFIKNQIKDTPVKHVAGESVAETRQSVHVHYRQCQTAQFSKYA